MGRVDTGPAERERGLAEDSGGLMPARGSSELSPPVTGFGEWWGPASHQKGRRLWGWGFTLAGC